jgi:hypothetical protein
MPRISAGNSLMPAKSARQTAEIMFESYQSTLVVFAQVLLTGGSEAL